MTFTAYKNQFSLQSALGDRYSGGKKAAVKKAFRIPRAEDSSSFDDAKKKLYIIRDNLRRTQDTLTNAAIYNTRAKLNTKAASTAWTDYGSSSTDGPLRNGDVVKLVPVGMDEYLALDNAIPVRVDLNSA